MNPINNLDLREPAGNFDGVGSYPKVTGSGLKYIIQHNKKVSSPVSGANTGLGKDFGEIYYPAGTTPAQVQEIYAHAKTQPEFQSSGVTSNVNNPGMTRYPGGDTYPNFDKTYARGTQEWDDAGNPITQANKKTNIASKMGTQRGPGTINGRLA